MAGLGGVWTLASHQLRGRLRQIIIWGVVLGALGALYVALFPSMGGMLEEYMSEAPEQMQQYIGSTGGELTIEQWLEMEFFNGIIPLALPFFMMVIGAKAIAGSEERKTLDLLLSNPVPRWQVVVGALLTMVLALAGVLAITWLLTYIAVPAAGVELNPGRLAQGLVTLLPFCLFFGSLALLVSALVRKAALAIVIPGVVLVGMYVVDALGQVSKSIEPLRVLTLQHHLGGSLGSDFPWTAFLIVLLVVCVLGAAAVAGLRAQGHIHVEGLAGPITGARGCRHQQEEPCAFRRGLPKACLGGEGRATTVPPGVLGVTQYSGLQARPDYATGGRSRCSG